MWRLALLVLVVTACADPGAVDTDETDVAADGAADAADPSVRVADTTLSVTHDLVRTGDTFVLRGKTSRTMTAGNAFVFDDPYGAFVQDSPRVFELSWQASEIRSLADGVDQFVALTFVHASGEPDSLTGHVVVRPRLAAFTGSAKLYVTAELAPVVVGGDVVYRISGHTTEANTGIELRIAGDTAGTVTRLDAQAFVIDLPASQAIDATAGADLAIVATFPAGGVEKHAHLGLAVKTLGLTAKDAYTQWPHPTCTPVVKACLLALRGDADDLSSCGVATRVLACKGTVGVIVDAAAIAGEQTVADGRLAAAQDDAVGLAGAQRAQAWSAGARARIAADLEALGGRWYMTPASRDGALGRTLDSGIDRAYARPLELIAPAPAVPADPGAMRQVAADAVLAELARMDFVHSEFGRSLEQLSHEFRAQHVASIRAFRETVTAEPYPGSTTNDVYIGDWLGAHTEVVVERATGTVISTLVELD